jgi:hypothetical protein
VGKFLGIRADWKALSFCVLAACTFWFLRALNNDYTDNVYYPFKIDYDDKKVVPLQKLPKYIRLNVKGYGWILVRNYIGIKVDPIVFKPSNLPRKKYALSTEVWPSVKKQLTDIEPNYIITDTIFFEFDRLAVKKVKVVIDSIESSLTPGYKITTPLTVSPDTISYKGPVSLLSKLPDTIHIRIPKTDIQDNFNQKIKIPDLVSDYRIELQRKEVRVKFGVNNFEKGSVSVAAKVINVPKGKEVKIENKVIITYYVEDENKNKVDKNEFEVYLDYNKMDKNDHTIEPILVKKPSIIKDFYFTPYAVKVREKK